MKAIWQGHVIAQSNQTIVLGGYHYFPRTTVDFRFLIDSEERGEHRVAGPLHYFHLQLPDGTRIPNAAWEARRASGEMAILAEHIAFEGCVEVKG